MTKKELVELLNDNFHDDTEVIFYDRENDTITMINNASCMFVKNDTLVGDYVALFEGTNS